MIILHRKLRKFAEIIKQFGGPKKMYTLIPYGGNTRPGPPLTGSCRGLPRTQEYTFILSFASEASRYEDVLASAVPPKNDV